MKIDQPTRDKCVATRDWLTEEQKLLFNAEFRITTPEYARNRVGQIVNHELPLAWKEFHTYRRISNTETDRETLKKLKLQVGQRALKACYLSQTAYAWKDISVSAKPLPSVRNTFKVIDGYLDEIKDRRSVLPHKDRLSDSLPDAVKAHTKRPESYQRVYPILRAVVGLAITAIHEQSPSRVYLPEPGHKLDDVVEWQWPPVKPEDTDHL